MTSTHHKSARNNRIRFASALGSIAAASLACAGSPGGDNKEVAPHVASSKLLSASRAGYAFVPDPASSQVIVLNTADNSVVNSLNLADAGCIVSGLTASPDGQSAIVTCRSGIARVTPLGITAFVESSNSLYIGEIAVHPNGSEIYITQPAVGGILILDGSTLTVKENVDTGLYTYAPVLNCDGSQLFFSSNGLQSMNTVTHEIRQVSSLSASEMGLVQGGRVIAAHTGDQITFLDSSTGAVIGTTGVPPGSYERGFAVDPDGTRLYVATDHTTVVAIDVSSRTVIGTVVLPDLAAFSSAASWLAGLAVDLSGRTLYAINNAFFFPTVSELEIIDTATLTRIGSIPIDQGNVDAITSDFVAGKRCGACRITGVPQFKQWIGPTYNGMPYWESHPYGEGGKYGLMAKYGCATTSGAMLLAYLGVRSQGVLIDPGELNAQLQARTGGYKGSSVNWIAVAQLAREDGIPLYFHGMPTRSLATDSQLSDYLCSGIPVITRVPGHFVLVTGQATVGGVDTWTLNDPAWNGGVNRTDLTSFSNDYQGLRLLSRDPAGAWLLAGGSPVELLVTDPEGRRVGFNPDGGPDFDEIPGASYTTEELDDDSDASGPPIQEKLVAVGGPTDGIYRVDVRGLASGPFTIHFFGYDANQDSNGTSVMTGQIESGATQAYLVTYAAAPSTGLKVAVLATLDVEPRSKTNPVNPNANGNFTVALLSTPTFDARTVGAATVRLGPGAAAALRHRTHLEDVDGDGDVDMVLHFAIADVGITCTTTGLTLTGETKDGVSITASDAIEVVGCARRCRNKDRKGHKEP